ncbi:piggyBac transposable element-derived protein 4-like [Haliotis asinina]|uniref:piggyBac transposable element-derived protein 4-like n=1 Tax=Haliotis asinina TaxID=109174 RepID=UPI003531C068
MDEASDEEFLPPDNDSSLEQDEPEGGVRKQHMVSAAEVMEPTASDGVNIVRACMSKNRFKTLMSCLRFDDKSTRSARRAKDAFAPFRDMWDQFTANLDQYYIAGPLLAIDKQLIPFRGRCNFLQYLPSKPDRYGIKIVWVCHCFPLLGIPYLGRALGRQVNLGRNTALQLAQLFFKSGRYITCDNYFTILELAAGCLKNSLTVVGTVRTNKRFLPAPFQKKRGLAVHSSEFSYGARATLVNYQGKKNKNTVVLSSMHDEGIFEEGAPKRKPEIILFYTSTKRAVDAMVKMAHVYTTKQVTKRWPKVMFANEKYGSAWAHDVFERIFTFFLL